MSDTPPTAGYQPLEGDADGALLRPPRRPKRSTLTPWRFCVGFCGLLGVAIVLSIAYALVSFARSAFKDISKPHAAIHANASLHTPTVAANESGIVRSFFGPKEQGGVERFDLKAAIWGRLGEFGEEEKPHDEPWQVVYEDTVLRDVDIATKAISAIHPVTISSSLYSALAQNGNSTLVASFVMLPSLSRLDSSLDHHTFHSSRNLSVFGSTSAYPPLNVKLDGVEGVFNHFLAGGVTASPLVTRWIQKTANTSGLPAGAEPVWTERNETFVKTRSWVSMADDYAVYNYTSFFASLNRRRAYRQRFCSGETGGSTEKCMRAFSTDGHFENLVEFDNAINKDSSTATRAGWRYGPFLTGRAAHAGAKDYVKVPENATGDFTFDWHVTWQRVTPAMLALGSDFLSGMSNQHLPANKTAVEIASGHDMLEVIHSWFGHRYQDNARPGTRAGIRLVQFFLSFIEMPLDAYYWISRSLSTGIALHPTVLDNSFGLLGVIIDIVDDLPKLGLATVLLGPGIALAYLLVVLGALVNLTFRLEWNWGGPGAWVPLGFSRRRPTKSELQSKRTEALFPWQYQLALFAVFYLVRRFGPELPHVVTASPPKPDPPSSETAATWFKFLTKELFSFDSAVQYALSRTLNITQIILNFRTGHFAGLHRLGALTAFAHNLLEHIPTVFTAFFGTWEMRAPVEWNHLLILAIGAVQVWQAVRLPVVPQEEREEDE
ncbi:hypothetical protein JCM10207_007284 [Rhodosporidiobolus poonsookiae]